MKYALCLLRTLSVTAALVAVTLFQPFAFGQKKDQTAKPPSAPASETKAPVQGYTRVNKHTGQPEQVRAYKRRLPKPKPVQVQPYTRGGKPVEGYQRRPPSAGSNGHSPSSAQP